MPRRLDDATVRLAAFEWLQQQTAVHGDVLPLDLLRDGFELQGERVRVASQAKGIFKPAVLAEMPLSILTSPESPYDDAFDDARGAIAYRYRGDDPMHPDNVGLRRAMQRQVPLVYLFGVAPARYMPVWPVFVMGDQPDRLTFLVSVDSEQDIDLERAAHGAAIVRDPDADARRQYYTATVHARLHQQKFRERVLQAYRKQCALCRLRHMELLDAAHIIPDREPDGEPVLPNGIALCKLHHAAFDRFFIGIRPDFIVEVRRDILDEDDGPMLTHGLQGMHNQPLILPARPEHRPDLRRIQRRYARFREMAS